MARDSLPDYARRFKAALDLRGWTIADLAAEIPPHYRLGKSTLDKISAGVREPLDWEYPLFAEKLAVPESFLRHGFEGELSLGVADQETIAQALEALTAALRPLLRPEAQPKQQPISDSSQRRRSA